MEILLVVLALVVSALALVVSVVAAFFQWGRNNLLEKGLISATTRATKSELSSVGFEQSNVEFELRGLARELKKGQAKRGAVGGPAGMVVIHDQIKELEQKREELEQKREELEQELENTYRSQ